MEYKKQHWAKNKGRELKKRKKSFHVKIRSWWRITSIPYSHGTIVFSIRVIPTPWHVLFDNTFSFNSWKICCQLLNNKLELVMSNKRGHKSQVINPPPFRFRSYEQWGRKINIINKPRSRLIFGQLFKYCKHVFN